MMNLQLFDKKQIFTFKIREVDSRDFCLRVIYFCPRKAELELGIMLSNYKRFYIIGSR